MLMQLSGAWVTSGNPGPFPGLSVLTQLWKAASAPGQISPNFLLWAPCHGFCHLCEPSQGLRGSRAGDFLLGERHTSVQVPQSHMPPHREGVTHNRPKATLYSYVCTSMRDPEFLNPTQLGEGWTR